MKGEREIIIRKEKWEVEKENGKQKRRKRKVESGNRRGNGRWKRDPKNITLEGNLVVEN